MLDYNELDSLLGMLQSDACAADCHGFLCGQICVNDFPLNDVWMEYLDIRSNDSMVIEGCCDDLDALKCETIRLLESPDFGFHPLLPDEDTPIIDRVSALGEWCHGFLNGFAMAQDVEFALEDRDSRELIENFTRICQLEVSDNPDEGDEKALFELVEYVRMGAIFIYAQAGSLSSGSNNGKGIYH